MKDFRYLSEKEFLEAISGMANVVEDYKKIQKEVETSTAIPGNRTQVLKYIETLYSYFFDVYDKGWQSVFDMDDPEEQSILIKKYFLNLTNEEIMEELKLKKQTYYLRLKSALEHFKKPDDLPAPPKTPKRPTN